MNSFINNKHKLHININIFYMEGTWVEPGNQYFQKKKLARRMPLYSLSAILFKFGLKEDSWIFLSSAFNLLQYAVLMEIYKENQASHKYVVKEKKSILICFCTQSVVLLHAM